MNKLKPTPDPSIPVGEAELTVYLSETSPNFVIKGQEEEVTQLAHQYVAERGKTIASTALKAVQAPVAPKTEQLTTVALTGRTALVHSLKAIMFDARYGTREYDNLRSERLKERQISLRLENRTLQSTRCAKHERIAASIGKQLIS